ncbi:unnamed protein product [Schistosoma turkestanicum]|nr:unnamed protein product [Schistosoma turkestanicum]
MNALNRMIKLGRADNARYFNGEVTSRLFPSIHISSFNSSMSQSITIPVTLIRSFKYRTTFYLPLSNIPRSATVKDLFDRIRHEIETSSVIPPPFKNLCFDALKIRHKAFKTKSGELLVDIEGDPIPSDSDQTLESLEIVNETEVAVFKMNDFLAQRNNPEFLW